MNPLYPQQPSDYVAQLIVRSTGLLGDFKMNVCAQIVANEHPSLSEDDIMRILRRYRSHVEFWNAAPTAIQNELTWFSNALNTSYDYVVQLYESLNWVGLIKYQGLVNVFPITSALHAHGIESKTWFGQVSRMNYVLVRAREHSSASSVVQSQDWGIQFQIVQPWEQVI